MVHCLHTQLLEGNLDAPSTIRLTMRIQLRTFIGGALVLCLGAFAIIARPAPVDDDLMAQRRVFPGIGPGLRAVKKGADGKYYVLASPNVGVAVFDPAGKLLTVIGAAPADASAASKAAPLHPAITFGEDCDVDKQGNIYVADRGSNIINILSPEGKLLRSIAVNSPISVAALPEGEVAVTTFRQTQLVTVFAADGRITREFGTKEELATREDLNRYLNLGHIMSDPQGHIYYGYTYLPEPLVRQYDRFGYGGVDFEFTGLDAYPEAQALRREIVRQEKREDAPSFHPVLTAFGVDPVNGDVWMALHNTLLHFDKDGNRRSEYQIYTKEGVRLEANVILVEENRLLIGSDPLGVYEFLRPDRNH
jgi:hypothetical protein